MVVSLFKWMLSGEYDQRFWYRQDLDFTLAKYAFKAYIYSLEGGEYALPICESQFSKASKLCATALPTHLPFTNSSLHPQSYLVHQKKSREHPSPTPQFRKFCILTLTRRLVAIVSPEIPYR